MLELRAPAAAKSTSASGGGEQSRKSLHMR
jgi:hypothetical protein